ncbi:hypothetical protein [Rubritalea marina]|uniref:hypothetical protein n=1 Tax=Rubritalea marina TaxID=361055 RepID=UPI00036DBF29|nr:hypothetical protein [Rubritalea marina]
MHRTIQHLSLSGIVLLSAHCGSMNETIYLDPNFQPARSATDKADTTASEESAGSDAPIAHAPVPQSTVEVEAAADVAAATAINKKEVKAPVAQELAPPKPKPSSSASSPFIQPDVYGIPSNKELNETSTPINSGGNSRRLGVPSNP